MMIGIGSPVIHAGIPFTLPILSPAVTIRNAAGGGPVPAVTFWRGGLASS